MPEGFLPEDFDFDKFGLSDDQILQKARARRARRLLQQSQSVNQVTAAGAQTLRYYTMQNALAMSASYSQAADTTPAHPNTSTGNPGKSARQKASKNNPITGQMSSFGAIGGMIGSGGGSTTAQVGATGDPWVYTQKPKKGKFTSGTSNGGWVLLPPEVSLSDVETAYAPVGITKSETFFIAGPGVSFGAGTPELANGKMRDGWSWGMETSTGDLVWKSWTNAGTSGTEGIRFSRTAQNIGWRSGTSFYGTVDHAITAARTWTFPDASGTVALVGGGTVVDSITGTANQVLANGTSGSPQTGAVTLTTPQDIHTAATPQFARLGLNSVADSNYFIFATLSLNGTTGFYLENTNTGVNAHNQIFLAVDGTGNADARYTAGKAVGGILSNGYSWGYDTSASAWVLSEGGDLGGANNAISVANTTRVVSVPNALVVGTTTFSGFQRTVNISGSAPGVGYYESDQGVDGKVWDEYIDGGQYVLRIVNDALSVATNWMIVTRSGTAITSIAFPNGNVGIGTTGPDAKLDVLSTSTQLRLTYTDGSVYCDIQTESSGRMYFIPSDRIVGVKKSNGGTDLLFDVSNTSNTASSGAGVRTIVAGSSGHDAYMIWSVDNVTDWIAGIDNSVSGDPFVLSASSALGTSDVLTVTTGGEVTVIQWLQVGTATDATAQGSFVAGLTAAQRFFIDSSNESTVFCYDASNVLTTIISNQATRETVFNESQKDIDLRIEGDSISHLLGTDATATTENIFCFATAMPNWQTMDRGFFIGDTSTAPTGNPTAGGFMYSNAGAGTWRGSGGTVTAFGPAGPHCGQCGYDAWTVATLNPRWKSWHFECGNCGKRYVGGPKDVRALLTAEQEMEILSDKMEWRDVARIMKIAV